MHRSVSLVVAALAVLVLAACTSATSPSPSASATAGETASPSASEEASESPSESAEESASAEPTGIELTVSETSAGPALAGEGALTLYTFANDTEGQSTCTGGCAENWPPLVVDEGEEAVAGEGVSGEIGTITRDDGTTQVTYDGHPLYYYVDDQNPGDATGHGVGDVWFIASPSGM